MCFLCNATQTFDPLRHGEDGAGEFAAITEGFDASASTATAYSMSVGDTFSGGIGNSSDEDWVAITLTAGETYRIDLTGAPSGNGTLSDPLLRLHSSSGTQIATNDDGGAGLESLLTYTATTSGTYYLVADAYSTNTGTYTLSVTTSQPPEAATLDEMADFLTDGYWQGTFRSGRSFDTSADNQISVNITGLTAEGQQLARWAFEAWERVANLDFVETGTGFADITFDDAASGAYAQSVTSGGTILSSEVNVSTSWLTNQGTSINSYSFQTYVHEIGHALGLGHQGAYNGNASYGTDETFSNDSWQLSVMSYFDQDDNSTITASFGYVVTTQMADIVAIQNLYGAAGENSETAGDTTWGANTTLTDSYLYDIFGVLEGRNSPDRDPANSMSFTIYDVSGTDTLDLSNNNTNDRIDLNDESFSDVAGLIGNVGIARGTVVENLIAGSGNDTITGNEADNHISAGDGADTISGGDGNDTINGGNSASDLRDVVYGGAGNDSIDGGYGNDELRGDAGNDSIEGGFGVDTVIGGVGDDVLTGSAWSDEVYGGTGEDFINGGFGSDRVNGGDDADRFFHLGIADHGSDWIQDYDHAEGDVLVFGQADASADQFQINFTETDNAGTAGVEEAFVIYRPTGQ
uniref:M10 family metallopeptidase C-terminal domain-containing protein n=1 Tax=Tritonibacter scottomollicae TaxID=483013 RepID=UPI003AA8050B